MGTYSTGYDSLRLYLFFHVQIYGLQPEKGVFGFPADSAVYPVFLGAGKGDCQGECVRPEDYPVPGGLAGTGLGLF